MDCSAISWFSEPELESSSMEVTPPLMNCNILPSSNNSLSTYSLTSTGEEDIIQFLSMDSPCNNNQEQHLTNNEEFQKPTNISLTCHENITIFNKSSSPTILDFQNYGNSSSDEAAVVREEEGCSSLGNNKKCKMRNNATTTRKRLPSQNYEHIMSERKRREQLSQRFLTLSSMLPGLKKMDKANVLSEAMKYLQQLQERVKTLEQQQQGQNHVVESFVCVRKSRRVMLEEGFRSSSSSNDRSGGGSPEEQFFPVVEGSVLNNSAQQSVVVLKIQCEKRMGVVVNMHAALEKLNLNVLSTSVYAVGSLIFDITVVAEMRRGIDLTLEDVVKVVREALSTE